MTARIWSCSIPERLDDRLDAYAESTVEQYGNLSRMVNRNDETVDLVLIGGRAVVRGGAPTEILGVERTGSFLRPGRPPAPRATVERSSPMSAEAHGVPAAVADTVFGMWKALSNRDWETLKTFVSDDCIYVDMPVGRAAAARGPGEHRQAAQDRPGAAGRLREPRRRAGEQRHRRHVRALRDLDVQDR